MGDKHKISSISVILNRMAEEAASSQGSHPIDFEKLSDIKEPISDDIRPASWMVRFLVGFR
jgi:hypothetical protein